MKKEEQIANNKEKRMKNKIRIQESWHEQIATP